MSTPTAILLVIGYECRIEGASRESIVMHTRGVQTMKKFCKKSDVALVDDVQRALFWQDLISCLVARTDRLLSHDNFGNL